MSLKKKSEREGLNKFLLRSSENVTQWQWSFRSVSASGDGAQDLLAQLIEANRLEQHRATLALFDSLDGFLFP